MLYSCIHPKFATNIPLSETLNTVGFNGLTSACYWNQQHATETADPPRAFHSRALNPLRRATGHPTAPKPTDRPPSPAAVFSSQRPLRRQRTPLYTLRPHTRSAGGQTSTVTTSGSGTGHGYAREDFVRNNELQLTLLCHNRGWVQLEQMVLIFISCFVIVT